MDSNKKKDNDESSYNSTLKKKHLAAASMLAFKLKQENKLKSVLKPHFKQVGRQVKKSYSKTGKLPSFKAHKDAVKGIINDHYVDTASKASTTLRENFKAVKNDLKLQALIDTQIERGAESRSEFAAGSIAETTENDFKRYLKNALINDALKSEKKSNAKQMEFKKQKTVFSDDGFAGDIGEDILNMFYDELENRLDLISQMETGVAANDGKSDEIDAIEDTDAEFEDGTTLADYKPKKTWIAIMDDRTRPEHAEADGQTVDYDEPYDVGGEELMEPLDDSLGASDWNIYGCRCESIESLE